MAPAAHDQGGINDLTVHALRARAGWHGSAHAARAAHGAEWAELPRLHACLTAHPGPPPSSVLRLPLSLSPSPPPSLTPSLPLSLSFPLSRFVALSLSGRPVMFVWCGAVSWHWGGKRACATPAGQPPPAAAAATCATPSWNGQPLLGSSASGTVAAPAQGNHRHARDTLAFLDRAPHCCCVCFWLCVCVFSPHTVCTRSGGVPTSRVQLTPPPNPSPAH
jgi:hypothetical protein